MGQTGLILECFIAGVFGVFAVMALLQVAVILSSKLARWIETNYQNDKPAG